MTPAASTPTGVQYEVPLPCVARWAADLNTISLTGPNCNVPNTTYGFTRK
jgi:hypothetical protein